MAVHSFVITICSRPKLYARRLFFRILHIISSPIRAMLSYEVRRITRCGYAIVSNNCIAGILYEIGGLEKKSPTVGLAFYGRAFAIFLSEVIKGGPAEGNLIYKRLSGKDLVIENGVCRYLLDTDQQDEIKFLHYRTIAMAIDKWNRRLDRLKNHDLLYVVSLRDGVQISECQKLLAPEQCLYIKGSSAMSEAPPADIVMMSPMHLIKIYLFLRTHKDKIKSPSGI